MRTLPYDGGTPSLLDVQQYDVWFAEYAQFPEVAEADGFAEKTLRENFMKAWTGKMVVL